MSTGSPPHSSLRIVSLVPSLTELLLELGLGPAVVGRTGFCIHPREAVSAIAKVGGTKDVNLAKIRRLRPSHVWVNVDENRRETLQALRELVPHVMVTHPCSPADNLALIDQVLGMPGLDNALDSIALTSIRMRANALKQVIEQRLQALTALRGQRRSQRVLYLIWRQPWMTVARDTYISRMLDLVGWQTWPEVHGGDGLHSPGALRYPALSGEEPWLGTVERVLLSSEPYRFGPQHEPEVRQWMQARGSHATVECVDGELLSWYGSRAAAGLAYLQGLAER